MVTVNQILDELSAYQFETYVKRSDEPDPYTRVKYTIEWNTIENCMKIIERLEESAKIKGKK